MTLLASVLVAMVDLAAFLVTGLVAVPLPDIFGF